LQPRQPALKEQGISPGKIDGIYGLHTAAAVNAFQVAHGLVPDGEVGPETAQALGIDFPQ
jgi:peptidoglycan hydrolase-like protein with peptidoglycan-binding domain